MPMTSGLRAMLGDPGLVSINLGIGGPGEAFATGASSSVAAMNTGDIRSERRAKLARLSTTLMLGLDTSKQSD
ncbi:MAG TPA: hypothetical protein VGN84_00815 [Solirubrobacterales bacterium]|nr:hypothetical protein [Solirubrobacterales bacterium]